jgi:hypothetical protein
MKNHYGARCLAPGFLSIATAVYKKLGPQNLSAPFSAAYGTVFFTLAKWTS